MASLAPPLQQAVSAFEAGGDSEAAGGEAASADALNRLKRLRPFSAGNLEGSSPRAEAVWLLERRTGRSAAGREAVAESAAPDAPTAKGGAGSDLAAQAAVAVWWAPGQGCRPGAPSASGLTLKRTRSHALLLGVSEVAGGQKAVEAVAAVEPLASAYGPREAARLSPGRGSPSAQSVWSFLEAQSLADLCTLRVSVRGGARARLRPGANHLRRFRGVIVARAAHPPPHPPAPPQEPLGWELYALAELNVALSEHFQDLSAFDLRLSGMFASSAPPNALVASLLARLPQGAPATRLVALLLRRSMAACGLAELAQLSFCVPPCLAAWAARLGVDPEQGSLFALTGIDTEARRARARARAAPRQLC